MTSDPDLNAKRLAVAAIISRWPSRKTLAEDISATVNVINKWATHGSINAGYDRALLAAADRRNIALHWSELQQLRSPRKPRIGLKHGAVNTLGTTSPSADRSSQPANEKTASSPDFVAATAKEGAHGV